MGIKFANACYTGGGVYLIYGTIATGDGFCGCLENGFYHVDRFYEPVDDSNLDSATDPEWCNDNIILLDPIESRNLLIKALVWVSDNKPDGNYNVSDLLGMFEQADRKMANNRGFNYV